MKIGFIYILIVTFFLNISCTGYFKKSNNIAQNEELNNISSEINNINQNEELNIENNDLPLIWFDGGTGGFSQFFMDINGVRSESYLSYYNIARIESLKNNIDIAYENLLLALFNGFPYLDHIKQNTDLNNLFNHNDNIIIMIEEIYNNGFNNVFAGKGYKREYSPIPTEEGKSIYYGWYYVGPLECHFLDSNNMIILDLNGWISAEYEIKNYNIIVKNIIYSYDLPEHFKMEYFYFKGKDFGITGDEGLYFEIPLKTEMRW
jgi:hypothetical protein